MFTRWTIGNFKSIREPITLELAPLTIFAGINSSGKSTLIQSILMVTQSLASSRSEGALVLNGNFVQLGNLSDVCHYGQENEPIWLGFEWLPTPTGNDPQSYHISLRSKVIKGSRPSQPGRRADVIWPTVMETTVALLEEHGMAKSNRPQVKQAITAVAAPKMKLYDFHRIAPSLQQQISDGLYNFVIDPKSSRPSASLTFDDRAERVSVNGLLPQRLLVISDSGLQQLMDDVEWLVRLLRQVAERPHLPPRLGGERRLSREWAEFIQTADTATLAQLRKSGSSHTEISRLDRILSQAGQRTLTANQLINELTSQDYDRSQLLEYANRLEKTIKRYPKERDRRRAEKEKVLTVEDTLLPIEYRSAVDQIREIARQRIYYLGPLRDDPRVIYQIPPYAERWSVGLKGEYTAAVLDEYANFGVHYPLPPGDHFDGEYSIKIGKLSDAVTIWLQRMGLVDSFDTEETPKIGYRLTVISPGLSKSLDLTSVGVGVSQVLPTLVQALLAPIGSVLIFEQPELHLHPKVQSVLADFFLGMTLVGKQCIVETHSEHLINRLRRRIVEERGRRVLSQIRIYFAEKEGTTTLFRPVEANEYGAILDWPEGFFDQAESEAMILLREQLQKRKRAANSSSQEVA